MKYKISAKAAEDIDSIWLFTASKWSVAQADLYYSLIVEEIKRIVSNFFIGKDFGHIRQGYRVSVVASHYVFYRKIQMKLSKSLGFCIKKWM